MFRGIRFWRYFLLHGGLPLCLAWHLPRVLRDISVSLKTTASSLQHLHTMAHGKYHEKASSIEVLDLLETNSDLNEYRLNPRSTTRSFWVWLLHASLLLGNGLWAISTTLSISSRAVPSANFPPLDSITRYSKQLWTLRFGQPTIYTNGSNSQVDAAWDEISAPPGKGSYNQKIHARLCHTKS